MSDERSDLGAEVRRLVEEDHGDGGHPSPEDLIAYHEGSLPEARAEELRDHLASCSQCTALLFEYDEHWADAPAAGAAGASEPWHRRPGPLRALAAVLAVLVLGLAAWIATHGPEAGAGTLSANLTPSTGGLRGGPAPTVIEIPERIDYVILILDVETAPGTLPATRYAAAVRFGDVLVAHAEAPLDEVGQLTVVVPETSLRTGDYEVVVSGSGAKPERLDYRFRVVRLGAAR